MNRSARIVCVLVAFVLYFTSPAHALLGGFEQADGYTLQQIPGSPPSDFTDVVYYNSGQFGANAGGGSPMQVTFNSPANLWTLLSEPGGFFATSAIRNPFVAATPPYPPYPFASTIPVYIVGDHFGGRTGSALALRNESGPVGPMEYDYKLDSYDFGGINPASVTTGMVSIGFYFCPNPVDPTREDKFIMSIVDSLGNVGLQLGYARDNSVYWRPGSSGAWNYPGIIADSTNYDGFTVNIDLSADTFELLYFDLSASNTITLAPAGTPLGVAMQDLTHLGWWLDDQITGGIGGKNFFDDFSFRIEREPAVPEPATAAMLSGAGFSLLLIRRRSRGVAVRLSPTRKGAGH